MIICYTVPEMTHDRCNLYFSFWAIFCPFIPPSPQKKQTKKPKLKKKMKKTPRDIIIIHMCTKNYDHNVHGQMDRQAD